MTFFVVIFNEVSNVMAGIGQQAQIISQLTDLAKSFGGKASAAWIGKDSENFVAELQNRLLPAFANIFSITSMINTNLKKALDIVQQADNQTTQLASGLQDVFNQIF